MVSRSQHTTEERTEELSSFKGNRRRKKGEWGKSEESARTEDSSILSPVSIDPNGSLGLIVGEERHVFRVDANALRRSSRVFDAMLFGGHKEAVQNTNWTVELPEDDSWAMRIILNAVHSNFGEVPKNMDTSGLYRITNKYDMTHCLQPWARIWASKADNPLLHENYQHSCDEAHIERIWVLYELGMYRPFEEHLLAIALDASATSDGDIQIRRHNPNQTKTKYIKLKDSSVLNASKVLGQSHISNSSEADYARTWASSREL